MDGNSNVGQNTRTTGIANPFGKGSDGVCLRLEQQLKTLLKTIPMSAKFGGATGNFNAHHVAYPEYDWKAFGNKFVNEVSGIAPGRVDNTDFKL
jgi:adenylosuccinate lyase